MRWCSLFIILSHFDDGWQLIMQQDAVRLDVCWCPVPKACPSSARSTFFLQEFQDFFGFSWHMFPEYFSNFFEILWPNTFPNFLRNSSKLKSFAYWILENLPWLAAFPHRLLALHGQTVVPHQRSGPVLRNLWTFRNFHRKGVFFLIGYNQDQR